MNKQHVTETALKMVEDFGLINLCRSELCKQSDISPGSFPSIMGCSFTEFVNQLKADINDNKIHTVNKSRANPTLRQENILNVALQVATERGYNVMTREAIAERAGVSESLVSRYFSTMVQLRRAVMRAAINQENIEVIAQGLAIKDKHARKAPTELKNKAAKLIAEY